MTRATVAMCTTLILITINGGVLSGQTHVGAIRGRVSDGAGSPLRGVELSLTPTLHATTDSVGGFLIGDIPPGRYTFMIRRVGYESKHLAATVFADDTIDAPIVLESSAARLDTVRTEATFPPQRRLNEYAMIKRSGVGTLIDSVEIAKHGGDKVSDVLRSKVNGIDYWERSCGGTAVAASGGVGGIIDMSVSKRVKVLNVGGCKVVNACYSQVFLDGSRVYSYSLGSVPPDIDRLTNLAQIEAIEVFKSGAPAPPEYNSTGSACGTISIWLKR